MPNAASSSKSTTVDGSVKLPPLLRLPDEILTGIIEHLEEPYHVRMHYYTPEALGDLSPIQNCRLTCRKLNAIASGMLFRIVAVSLTDESVSRFTHIASNPAFSQGVRSVQLHLHHHDQWLSKNLWQFAEAHYKFQVRHISYIDRHGPGVLSHGRPEAQVGKAEVDRFLVDAQAIIETWRPLMARGEEEEDALIPLPESGEERHHRARLRAAHAEYTKLYEMQDRLLEDGEIVSVLKTGMAKMSRVRILGIFDRRAAEVGGNIIPLVSCFHEGNFDALYRPLLLQSPGLPTAPLIPRNTLAYILPYLGPMLSSAGVALDEVLLRPNAVHMPLGKASPAPGSIQAQTLPARLQLKRLEFHCWQYSAEWNSTTADESFCDALCTFCTPGSLREVEILIENPAKQTMPVRNRGAFQRRDISPFLTLLDPQRLVSVKLAGFGVEFAQLNRLLRADTAIAVSLEFVRLLSGTWAEILETCRKNGRRIHLKYPFGAECNNLGPKDYHRLFSLDEGFECEAGLYMAGQMDENPLLEYTP
jgi:hypothetical protein